VQSIDYTVFGQIARSIVYIRHLSPCYMFRLLQSHRPGRICQGFEGQPTLFKMCVRACVCIARNMNYVIQVGSFQSVCHRAGIEDAA
jgi:hypothetical protein